MRKGIEKLKNCAVALKKHDKKSSIKEKNK